MVGKKKGRFNKIDRRAVKGRNFFKSRTFIVLMVFLAAIVFVVGIQFGYTEEGISNVGTDPVLLTPENLPAYLSSNSIIKEMPSSAKLTIYFGDRVYSLKDEEIILSEIPDPEIIISIPENYLNHEWTSFCSLAKTASSNGDLQVNLIASKTKLALKYRNLIKYRDCL